jgi:hypothetical protein
MFRPYKAILRQLFIDCIRRTASAPTSIQRVFRAQSDWTLTHTGHEDTEQSTIEASITLDGVTLTHCSGDHRMNDLQFVRRYHSVCRYDVLDV